MLFIHFSFIVCCSFVLSANRSSMERKKSEEMVVLIHICSFMFTVITVLSNLCYMLFSSEPNEVHTNDNDPDEEWVESNAYCLSLRMGRGKIVVMLCKKKSVVWSHKFKTSPFSFYNREGALSYSEKKKKLIHSLTLQHLSYWVGSPLGQNLTHKQINLWRIEGEKSRGFDSYQLSLDDCFSV